MIDAFICDTLNAFISVIFWWSFQRLMWRLDPGFATVIFRLVCWMFGPKQRRS